jgi:hypothetical protein
VAQQRQELPRANAYNHALGRRNGVFGAVSVLMTTRSWQKSESCAARHIRHRKEGLVANLYRRECAASASSRAREDADMERVGTPDLRRAFWFGLAAAVVLGVVWPVSAQMLEGTLSGTFAAFGTVNAQATGKERTVLAIDENGLSVTNGILDHMTWHCSGLADFTNGIGQTQGFCAGRDPVGDQVVFNWESEKHAPEQKVVRGTLTWTGGTGKYAGIRGSGTYVDYSGEFQPLTEGEIVSYLTFEGNYRTPATQ